MPSSNSRVLVTVFNYWMLLCTPLLVNKFGVCYLCVKGKNSVVVFSSHRSIVHPPEILGFPLFHPTHPWSSRLCSPTFWSWMIRPFSRTHRSWLLIARGIVAGWYKVFSGEELCHFSRSHSMPMPRVVKHICPTLYVGRTPWLSSTIHET